MELQMDVPTSMELQSQTTRLVEQIRVRQVRRRSVTGFSPSPMSYSKERLRLSDSRYKDLSYTYISVSEI